MFSTDGRRRTAGLARPTCPLTFPVENTSDPVRLDIWLDVACLFKTRSEAQRACKGGKVEVNGQSAKPHREIKPAT